MKKLTFRDLNQFTSCSLLNKKNQSKYTYTVKLNELKIEGKKVGEFSGN